MRWVLAIACAGCFSTTSPGNPAVTAPPAEAPRDAAWPSPPPNPPTVVRITQTGCLAGDCSDGIGVAWRTRRVSTDLHEGLLDGRFVRGRLVDGTLSLYTSGRLQMIRIAGDRAVIGRDGYTVRGRIDDDPLPMLVGAATLEVPGLGTIDVQWSDRIVDVGNRIADKTTVQLLAAAAADLDAGFYTNLRVAWLEVKPPIKIVSDLAAKTMFVVDIGPIAAQWEGLAELRNGTALPTFDLPIVTPRGIEKLRIEHERIVDRPAPVRVGRAWQELVPSRLDRARSAQRDAIAALAAARHAIGARSKAPALEALDRAKFAIVDGRLAMEQAFDALPSRSEHVLAATVTATQRQLRDFEQRLAIAIRALEGAELDTDATRAAIESAIVRVDIERRLAIADVRGKSRS